MGQCDSHEVTYTSKNPFYIETLVGRRHYLLEEPVSWFCWAVTLAVQRPIPTLHLICPIIDTSASFTDFYIFFRLLSFVFIFILLVLYRMRAGASHLDLYCFLHHPLHIYKQMLWCLSCLFGCGTSPYLPSVFFGIHTPFCFYLGLAESYFRSSSYSIWSNLVS